MKLAGSISLDRVYHHALLGNRLGDPSTRTIPVYTPSGFNSDRKYPVVYYLPGFTGTSLSAINESSYEPNLVERFDRQIQRGEIPPALLVIADGFTKLGGSQYINSTFNGRYEDAIANNLVDYVDKSYPTITAPEGRAIVGKSSGGYGALVLGMRHSARFGLVASHSGDAYFEYCYLPDFPKYTMKIAARGGVAGYLEWFRAQDYIKGDTIGALNVLGMAAAYSPNAAADGGIDLPFDMETGELTPAVWSRWLEHDPVRLVEKHADALRGLRLLYIDCGTRDEYNLQYGARILSKRLSERGIEHVHQEFDDGHMGITYRADVSFKLIGEKFRELVG
jgi:enterochelin esterase family protein